MSHPKETLADKLVDQITKQEFNEDSWLGFSQNCLRKKELSLGVAQKLIDFLFSDRVPDTRYKLQVEAIAECLENSSHFANIFDGLKADQINKTLSLDEYFDSGDMEDDSEDAESSNSINLRMLRLIYQKCRSYRDGSKFADLGLKPKRKELLMKCVSSEQKESMTLANILNNASQNKRLNILLDSFAKLAKPVTDNLDQETAKINTQNRIKEALSILDKAFQIQQEIVDKKVKLYQQRVAKFNKDKTKRLEKLKEDLEDLQEKIANLDQDDEGTKSTMKKHKIDRLNIETKIKEFDGEEKKMTDQLALQKEIIEQLKDLHHTAYLVTKIMLETSQPLDNHSHIIQDIFEKMIAVIEMPVALIVIGLIKTGKSTIVNKLLGQNLAPHRNETMTAIPVRYINTHPENGQKLEVEMVVPFYSDLNKIIRILRKKEHLLSESERALYEYDESQDPVAPSDTPFPGLWKLKTHMLRLLSNIADDGFRFKRIYTGRDQVLKASEQIHDLFRLCVQEAFLEIFRQDNIDLTEKLPLNWAKGLDNFLIVSLPLPDFADATNIVDFSVVDTPGVNEAHVEKLELKKMVFDSAQACHYLGFTISLQTLGSESDEKLIRSTVQTLKDVPTIVFGTRVDRVEEGQRGSLKQSIMNFVRGEENPIPSDNIHLVSGLMGSIADQMESFIKETGKKPSITSEIEAERKLAKEFAFYVCSGANQSKKIEDYNNNHNAQKILAVCKDLRNESNMEGPIKQLREVGVMRGIVLSLFFSLCKQDKMKDLKEFLGKVIENQNIQLEQVEKRKTEIENASNLLEQKIIEIRKNQKKEAEELVSIAKKELIELVEDYIKSGNLPDILKGGQQEFKLEKKAVSDKVEDGLRDAQGMFAKKANEYLSNLSNKFRNWSKILKKQLEGDVIEQLQKIFSQEMTNQESVDIDVSFDWESIYLAKRFISEEQRKTVSKKAEIRNLLKLQSPWSVKENVIVVDSESLRKMTRDIMMSRIEEILPVIHDKARKMVNQLVENFFLRAMLFLNQESQLLESKKLSDAHAQQVRELKNTYEKELEKLNKLFIQVTEKHNQLLTQVTKKPNLESVASISDRLDSLSISK